MTGILVVDDLHAGYGPRRVLHGISFSLQRSGILVVLGANGAGKTTLLRSLSGLITPTGAVRLEDLEIGGLPPAKIARLGITQVPQGRGVFPGLTVEDNLRAGASSLPRNRVGAQMERWLDFFPRLRERKRQQAGSLSGGEQQMLGIARALMLEPKVLLLDEPSLGLAPKITTGLFAHLRDINRETGTAMLVVEQNANLALEIADDALLLQAGHVVASADAETFRHDNSIRRAYLGD